MGRTNGSKSSHMVSGTKGIGVLDVQKTRKKEYEKVSHGSF